MRSNSKSETASLNPMQKAWVLFSISYSIGYLLWRALMTTNQQNAAYSWLFWVAEVIGFLSSLQFFVSTYRIRKRESRPLKSNPTVDVLIPTYNEDVNILFTTIYHCVNMDYPHQTYVLDDGRRPEIEKLAKELGAHYIARSDNKHAKAGNLNHALRKTTGEIIAVFDADGIPRKDFLTKLLGFFEDQDVGLVQAPQTFYNLDSFQHSNRALESLSWNEQALFFDVIEPGRDYHDASMCCGSGSLVRRSALKAIGGISIGTLTEDLHTTLKLHAEGFRSVYYSEPLAFCLAPSTLKQFVVQRGRWATGCFQVFFKELRNIIGPSRLTLAQRFLYAPFYYLTAIQRALYVLAAPAYLVLGLNPIQGPSWFFYPMFAYLVLSVGSYYILSRGRARLVLTEIFFLYNLLPYLKAIVLGCTPKLDLKFRVTSKSVQGESSAAILLPVFALFQIGAFTAAWGAIDAYYDGASPGGIFATGCAAFYAILCAGAMIRGGKMAFWREAYSFFDPRPVRIRTTTNDTHFAVATAISERRIRLHQTEAFAPGEKLEILIELPSASLELHAEVAACKRTSDASLFEIELRYDKIDENARILLLRYFFEDATPRVMSTFCRSIERARKLSGAEKRSVPRAVTLLPAVIRTTQRGEMREYLGLIDDLSEGGGKLRIGPMVEPGSNVTVEIPWKEKTVKGEVVRCQREQSQMNPTFELGVRFESNITPIRALVEESSKLRTAIPA